MKEDDLQLVDQLQSGNETAFDSIFLRYQPRMVFFANRLLGNSESMDAEEIVQDAFIRFYDRRQSFTSIAHVQSFLYLIVKNSCLDKIAKNKVHSKRFERFISHFDETEEGILAQMTYAEVIQEISAAIETLPERCRIIMKKFVEEEKNAQQIAKELDITVSTVNNQRARAISLLRHKLSHTALAYILSLLMIDS